jgi:hypothetical protein
VIFNHVIIDVAAFGPALRPLRSDAFSVIVRAARRIRRAISPMETLWPHSSRSRASPRADQGAMIGAIAMCLTNGALAKCGKSLRVPWRAAENRAAEQCCLIGVAFRSAQRAEDNKWAFSTYSKG